MKPCMYWNRGRNPWEIVAQFEPIFFLTQSSIFLKFKCVWFFKFIQKLFRLLSAEHLAVQMKVLRGRDVGGIWADLLE